MYVSNLMVSKEDLVTVTRDDSIQFALDLIEKNDFRDPLAQSDDGF